MAAALGRYRRPLVGWQSLTKSERAIVSLVVEGLSNPQIAERLCVSRRTVSTHLYRIFKKVGVSSRAELVAGAVRRELADPSQRERTNPSLTDDKYVT